MATQVEDLRAQFDALVEQVQEKVYQYAIRRADSKDVGEDVFQEEYVRMWERFPRLTAKDGPIALGDPISFKVYWQKAIKTRLRNMWRRNREYAFSTMEGEDEQGLIPRRVERASQDHAHGQEFSEHILLRHTLANLQEAERQALSLTAEGFNSFEAADSIGLEVEAFDRLLGRARQHAQRLLEGGIQVTTQTPVEDAFPAAEVEALPQPNCLAELIIAKRRRRGWDLIDLVLRGNVSPVVVDNLEQGKSNPSKATLAKLIGALGIQPEELEQLPACNSSPRAEYTALRKMVDPLRPKAASLAQLIAAKRQQRGWSQGVLAEKSGIHVLTLINIEEGRTKYPLPRTVEALVKALKIMPDELPYWPQRMVASERYRHRFAELSTPLGRLVCERRIERGWTQEVLAARAGTHQAAISLLELNGVKPSKPIMQRIATLLDFPPESLQNTRIEPVERHERGPEQRLAPSDQVQTTLLSTENIVQTLHAVAQQCQEVRLRLDLEVNGVKITLSIDGQHSK